MAAFQGERGVTFDENFQIRVLDPEKSKKTTQLQEDCTSFIDKVDKLQLNVNQLVEALETQAQKVESEKLKAVGFRNKLVAEDDYKRRMKAEQQALISEKQRELERLNVEYESLMKVRQEQELLIGKLSNTS